MLEKIQWYMNRLQAMSLHEIFWRMGQKKIEYTERKLFQDKDTKITDKVFYHGRDIFTFHKEKLPVSNRPVYDNNRELLRKIFLLGGYDYDVYKKNWHIGFQTINQWERIFSYDLCYKQRDEIGDARTNWELNRHFQFGLLACNYYQSGEERYLAELSELFEDWNKQNPFLHGISWTSVMEVAIRDINWIFTLGFLALSSDKNLSAQIRQKKAMLCEALRIGIINMTEYISAHYSRFSSANNHVIVEAAAMGIAGIVLECDAWMETAVAILRKEIPRQNYEDGVNKEVSLHYQSFFMEAAGLLILVMQKNKIRIPENWRVILTKMGHYLSDCQGNYGETVVFGDDDEGKIIDFEGFDPDRPKRNHYQYVLELMSVILPERYTEKITDKTLLMLVSDDEIQKVSDKPWYQNKKSICYEKGGVSLLKSDDGRILMGIDHGELGFGSIAAHGHADALSFQMYMDGECVFADPGTYIYHINLEKRNAYRKTQNHNTLTLDHKDQSVMKGAFLWGKRAETVLLGYDFRNEEHQWIEAEHNGYEPVIHRRRYAFNGRNKLEITDSLERIKSQTEWQIVFLMAHGIKAAFNDEGIIYIKTKKGSVICLRSEEKIEIWQNGFVSDCYGMEYKTLKIIIRGIVECDKKIKTEIFW